MRKLLQKIFRPFCVWLADKFSDAPKRDAVFKSLDKLYKAINTKKSSRGIVIEINAGKDDFIIFSDQHKGTKGYDDDFKNNEINYIEALKYYLRHGYSYINLGDAEELWKFPAEKVIPQNTAALQAETSFQLLKKYYRTFGNHDLLWKNKLDVMLLLRKNFKMPLPVYEGIVLRAVVSKSPETIDGKLRTRHAQKTIDVFLTHGHQGDVRSDNNAFSSWFVAHIWSPVQRYLQININTPAKDFHLRDKHNKMMYDWSSARKNLLLITGHTHKPVFASGRYIDDADKKIATEDSFHDLKPIYFNTGCCCFSDGDITGIEISGGYIRLVKWHNKKEVPERVILEEKKLEEITRDL